MRSLIKRDRIAVRVDGSFRAILNEMYRDWSSIWLYYRPIIEPSVILKLTGRYLADLDEHPRLMSLLVKRAIAEGLYD